MIFNLNLLNRASLIYIYTYECKMCNNYNFSIRDCVRKSSESSDALKAEFKTLFLHGFLLHALYHF